MFNISCDACIKKGWLFLFNCFSNMHELVSCNYGILELKVIRTLSHSCLQFKDEENEGQNLRRFAQSLMR